MSGPRTINLNSVPLNRTAASIVSVLFFSLASAKKGARLFRYFSRPIFVTEPNRLYI